MKGIKSHSHDERGEIVQKLIPIIKEKLEDNLIALAAGGSYARTEDSNYSDIELVAFVKQSLSDDWEIRKIVDGLYIVAIVDTRKSYIEKYLDVSDIWYASGADKLLPIINNAYISEINAYKPSNVEQKCLEQIQKRWYTMQEITAKTLNMVMDNNTNGFSIIFHQMLKEMLIILSYLNQTPYITLSSYITQAKQFNIKPDRFDELADMSITGQYQNLYTLNYLIEEMYSSLEGILEQKDLVLYSTTL